MSNTSPPAGKRLPPLSLWPSAKAPYNVALTLRTAAIGQFKRLPSSLPALRAEKTRSQLTTGGGQCQEDVFGQ